MSSVFVRLLEKLDLSTHDPEVTRLSPGLEANITFVVGDARLRFRAGGEGFHQILDDAQSDIQIAGTEESWAKVLTAPPPPLFQSFTAFQIANTNFEVLGHAQKIAQARPLLERVIEIATLSPAMRAEPVERSLGQIRGQYGAMQAVGHRYEVYYETAGQGTPILFLHTAGADGRQYFGQMADIELAKHFKMFAVDLPFHGKSMPPRDWNGESYGLTAALYRDWCAAFIEQIIGGAAIVVGGSMGAAMALVLAAERPDLLRGAVALEPPFRSKGRRNPFQNHVGVHAGLHNAAFVRGLMSPTSPLSDRRRAAWIYAQGGPGIYPGDLAFYSDEFDGGITGPQVDTKKVPVALLSGTYDYSATPEDGAKLASLIPGALHLIMPGLGHFPMVEHPDLFRPWLVHGLTHVNARSQS